MRSDLWRSAVELLLPLAAAWLTLWLFADLVVGGHAGPMPVAESLWFELVGVAVVVGWAAGRTTWLLGARARWAVRSAGAMAVFVLLQLGSQGLGARFASACEQAGGRVHPASAVVPRISSEEGLVCVLPARQVTAISPGRRVVMGWAPRPGFWLFTFLVPLGALGSEAGHRWSLLRDPTGEVVDGVLRDQPVRDVVPPTLGGWDARAARPLQACARRTPWGVCGQPYGVEVDMASRCVRCGFLPVPSEQLTVRFWLPHLDVAEELDRAERSWRGSARDDQADVARERWRSAVILELPEVLTVAQALAVWWERVREGAGIVGVDPGVVSRVHAWGGPAEQGGPAPIGVVGTWRYLPGTSTLIDAVAGSHGPLDLVLDAGVFPVALRQASEASPLVAWIPTRQGAGDPASAAVHVEVGELVTRARRQARELGLADAGVRLPFERQPPPDLVLDGALVAAVVSAGLTLAARA